MGVMDIPQSGSDASDVLADSPSRPPLRTAMMPKPSSDASALGGKTALLLSGSPAEVMAKGMMSIEKLVKEMSQYAPIIQQIFAPAIQQARDIAAASLANLAAGGMGAAELGGNPAPPLQPGTPPPMPPPMMGGGPPQ